MDKNGGIVAVIVAAIGALGVIGAAYFGSVGKSAEKPAVVPPPVAVATSPASAGAQIPAPVQQAPPTVAGPAQPVKEATIPVIAGTWYDDGGRPVIFTQDGATFRESGTFNNVIVIGQGAIIDRQLRWTYQNNIGGSGECSGTLGADDRSLTASCRAMNAPPYAMQLNRVS